MTDPIVAEYKRLYQTWQTGAATKEQMFRCVELWRELDEKNRKSQEIADHEREVGYLENE